jgi:tetratricopeptide (TPR) repeat protein
MADATAATTPKIEELRARLKADPKSRHFYPLAEELRKFHQLEQAEEILREGLQGHPTYLSAWISLGRVLRDRSRDHEAVEVLKRALSLDAGNVVAAKLLAQSYLGVGDKVEAIKKFKLVYALMPADAEVEAEIERLDRELNPQNYAPPAVEPAPVVEPPFAAAEEVAEQASAADGLLLPEPSRYDMTDSHPFSVEEEPFGSTSEAALSSLLESSAPEPSASAGHDVPAIGDAGALEEIIPAVPVSELTPEPEPFGEMSADPVSDSAMAATSIDESESMDPEGDLVALPTPIPATLTMAQLYESQGHEEQAAELYKQILEQQPDNVDARSALSRAVVASEHAPEPLSAKGETIDRLEKWRAKVTRS